MSKVNQRFIEAQKFESKGEFKKAYELYYLNSEENHADSIYMLAQLTFRGTGVTENKEKSFQLYMKAAKLGHSEAKAMVAGCYLTGNGVKTDYLEAAKWLYQANEEGSNGAAELIEQMPRVDPKAHQMYLFYVLNKGNIF